MTDREIKLRARAETLRELAVMVVGTTTGGAVLGGGPGEILFAVAMVHSLIFLVFLGLYVKDRLCVSQ